MTFWDSREEPAKSWVEGLIDYEGYTAKHKPRYTHHTKYNVGDEIRRCVLENITQLGDDPIALALLEGVPFSLWPFSFETHELPPSLSKDLSHHPQTWAMRNCFGCGCVTISKQTYWNRGKPLHTWLTHCKDKCWILTEDICEKFVGIQEHFDSYLKYAKRLPFRSESKAREYAIHQSPFVHWCILATLQLKAGMVQEAQLTFLNGAMQHGN
jgi:hypothetical protein